MNKKLLLIFTRNPELGKVKTRLAKTVGDEIALEIYKYLLQKTQKITSKVTSDKAVYYSVKIRENDIWEESTFQKNLQNGEDLGIRMLQAFKNSFKKGYQKVIIIGSDLPDITTEIIDEAFLQLDSSDVVLGPATDGGYYLLGMNTLHEKIFKNKNWGTDTVRAATLSDLKDKKVHLLPALNDVDVFADIENHPDFQHFLK
ncbi:TIGR04282 family arsenosugar biosynthesis glycosyltransferase [uncultured Polaribacter sp.]|uniref:TIGR04282 family arsenosugar biosynthesis glycosyltransferase n=1 Tax=uncultured Polaribacter sp. TaxID=174711 RepID=UPI00260BD49E|nr:TIGR04282 family arsenosugar biosynthesis glycosyltransferase [uncultured Polaribacter sp.]